MADAVKTDAGLELKIQNYTYMLPESLQGKRIEEISWDEMDMICV